MLKQKFRNHTVSWQSLISRQTLQRLLLVDWQVLQARVLAVVSFQFFRWIPRKHCRLVLRSPISNQIQRISHYRVARLPGSTQNFQSGLCTQRHRLRTRFSPRSSIELAKRLLQRSASKYRSTELPLLRTSGGLVTPPKKSTSLSARRARRKRNRCVLAKEQASMYSSLERLAPASQR